MANKPPVPLGRPIRLTAAVGVLAQVTRAQVQDAARYWQRTATGLGGLLTETAQQAPLVLPTQETPNVDR